MKFRRIIFRIVIAGALFFGGVMLFNFVLMPMLVHQRGSVIVPDLANTSRTHAEETLSRMGLNLRVDRSEHHPSAPEDYVVSQSPRPNESIKEGRTVEVVLSLGARTQVVPELKGMSLRQARVVLQSASLLPGRISRVHAVGEAREEVIATTPTVGQELVEGSTVDLVISVGGTKERFVMPDLIGQDLLFIREKLRERGFRVSGVRYEKRDGVFPNTIVGQTPRPGALIRGGDSIELVAASSD